MVETVETPSTGHQNPTAGVAWPLSPRPEIAHAFAPPAQRWGQGHRGVDLLGEPGQLVLAPLAGTVTFAGHLAGRGVVVVEHGPQRTTYEPVAGMLRVGATVRRGDPIGTLQGGPGHCAPRFCLHWGLLEGTSYLDPLGLVRGGPVRLLPLPPDRFTRAGERAGRRS